MIFRKSTGKQACIVNNNGYMFTVCKRNTIYLHRLIWVLSNGPIPNGMEIDHINGNPSDNRIENLRLCNRSQNCQNVKRRKDNLSGAKGVFFDSFSKTWRGCVSFKKKKHYTQRFKTLEEARVAVEVVRLQLHGEFCNHGLNQEEAA
jgi:hypothetical protein